MTIDEPWIGVVGAMFVSCLNVYGSNGMGMSSLSLSAFAALVAMNGVVTFASLVLLLVHVIVLQIVYVLETF